MDENKPVPVSASYWEDMLNAYYRGERPLPVYAPYIPLIVTNLKDWVKKDE